MNYITITDSYLGRDDFLKSFLIGKIKILKFVSAQIYFFVAKKFICFYPKNMTFQKLLVFEKTPFLLKKNEILQILTKILAT